MIIVKDKTQEKELTFINPKSYIADKYTVLLQNILTKEITSLNVLDRGNGIYLKFYFNLGAYQDGEYLVMLFENPEDKYITAYDANNIKETLSSSIYYLMDDGALLTDDIFFLIEDDERKPVKPIKTDLLKIGVYLRNKTTYRSEQTYIQYNK